MYYILITDGLLREIIPGENPLFPSVAIEDRYAPELLGQCVLRDTLDGLELGMRYDTETDRFYWPETASDPADPPTPAPTELERLTARVDYLSLMTGVDV